ncbi:MAG: acetate--CoA ligase family protein [Thermodesulfobacteriota bacterium]
MIPSIQENPLYAIANPGSIAFFGASNNFSAMGTNILQSVQSLGYAGRIYPVHPKEKRVMNLPAHADVADLPETPDMAFIVLPTDIVIPTLEACGRKGIRHAVIVSAGFNEVGGKGVDLQQELLRVARQYGIRFSGPNCIGVVNPHHRLNATFLPYEARPGFIGIASQSGSFVTQMFNYLDRFGLGFSTGFSLGNEADIDLVDAIEYLGACPHTRVIAMYVESIRRGRAFIEAARSIIPRKPVVAFYVGGSEAGKRACFSHTGALAGSDRLYDGIFRQSGVIRARSIEEMFDFCYAFGASPPPRGNRVIIQTHSGGPGAAAADAGGRAGLALPALTDETVRKLAPYMPHTGSSANPIDLTYTKNPLDYFHTIPDILLEDADADALLVYFLASSGMVRRALEGLGIPQEESAAHAEKIIADQCKAIASLVEKHRKPLIGYSFLTRENPFIRGLQDLGVPVLGSPERAARAAGAMATYVQLKQKILESEKSSS